MSADRYSSFYALSSKGWLSIADEQSLATDYVRIYEVETYQGSPFGRTSRHWKMRRQNPTSTDAEANALEDRFPRPAGETELSAASLDFLNNLGKH